VTQPGFTGLSFHTSRYFDEPVCPPIMQPPDYTLLCVNIICCFIDFIF
jgi:hypothetical protein